MAEPIVVDETNALIIVNPLSGKYIATGVPLWQANGPPLPAPMVAMGYYIGLLFGLALPTIVAACILCCCRPGGARNSRPTDVSDSNKDTGAKLRLYQDRARVRKFRVTWCIMQIGWFVAGLSSPLFWYLGLGVMNVGGQPTLDGCWPGITFSGALYLAGLIPIGVSAFLLAIGPVL